MPDPVAPPGFWARFRADLGRRGEERTWVIWYLIVEKALQGGFFMLTGVVLLIERHRLPGYALRAIDQYELDVGRDFLTRLVHTLLLAVAGTSGARFVVIGVGAMLHASLELTESVGLFLQRRWAEYLVVLATGFLIPVEVDSIVSGVAHPRVSLVWKIGVLVVNLLIVVYLVHRKKLFGFDLGEPEQ